MEDHVKRYRERRDARIKARKAREDDQWITMKGTHVMIDDGGQVSKGPEKLRNVVKQGGGYKSKAERKYGSNEKFSKSLNGGWTQKNSGGNLESKIKKYLVKHSGGYSEEEYEAIRKQVGANEAEFKKAWNAVQDKDRYATEIKNFLGEKGKKIGSVSEAEKEGLRKEIWADKDTFDKVWNSLKEESDSKAPDGGSATASYDRIPFSVRMSRKHADPEEVKQARATVSRFMKEAKEGNVYEVGGGVGSKGGQRFEITTRGSGKDLYIGWIDENGRRSSRPVKMSRSNVESFIANGAKLVSK